MSTFFSPAYLLQHFIEYLPRLSDRFSDSATVTAEIVAGVPQVLRVTDIAHNLTVGRQVVFTDTKIDNSITNVELIVDPIGGDVLRFTTALEHDLTLNYTKQIELSGFTDPQFNGLFTLVNVPSRNLFEVSGDTEPVLNGNEVLREKWEVGLDGIFTIDRLIDDDTYEIDLINKPEFAPQTIPNIRRVTDFRMSVAVDAERAAAYYTKQETSDSLYLFIIMGDAAASKNRTLSSDANQTNTAQNPSRILMINTFDVLVFFPTHNETLGANASNLAWDEVLKLMLTTGAGIRFDDFGNTRYLTSLVDHGTAIYNNAYYGHVYTFEYNYEITQEENFLTQFITSRAFRDDAISFSDIQDGSNLDLDGDEDLT